MPLPQLSHIYDSFTLNTYRDSKTSKILGFLRNPLAKILSIIYWPAYKFWSSHLIDFKFSPRLSSFVKEVTPYNQPEQAGTSQNEAEQPGTSWNKQKQSGTTKNDPEQSWMGIGRNRQTGFRLKTKNFCVINRFLLKWFSIPNFAPFLVERCFFCACLIFTP